MDPMSNKTTDTSSLQTTKQMLDELDALMEKMLSLPVNDPDDAAPFPEAVVKPSLLPPTLSATLTLLQAPAPVQAEQTPTPHPAVNPPHFAPTMRLEAPPTVQERVPQLEPLTNEVMPPSMLDQLTPLLREIPVPSSASAMRWEYLPLMWINQEFDRATTLLGGSGAGLRSQAGRTLLGVSGVALMLVAVTWFLRDWFGWN
jgi:hypothetical protein